MNNYRKLIPFLMLWEEGVKTSLYNKLGWQDYFAECKKRGIHLDPNDSGGATICGITLGTFAQYRKLKGLEKPTPEDLVLISGPQWLDIYKTMFWDKCQGDKIESQAIADMIVDWYWTSGSYAAKRVQKLVGAYADGIIGPKSVAAINAKIGEDYRPFLSALTDERIDYYKGIVKHHPAKKKFLNGWINRANACKEWK